MYVSSFVGHCVDFVVGFSFVSAEFYFVFDQLTVVLGMIELTSLFAVLHDLKSALC